MLLMILKMSAITLVYVALTFFLWRILKDREMNWGIRIGLGVIYGLTSILSTHFGVDYGDMMLNVRDLGPMSAGLFFDPVSGIIAGLIGGIERYIAGTYFGVASFTRVACSISTCLAGFFAAFMNIYVFNRKRPSATYAFFMGAAIEVFHMYVVFISHRNDMEMAFTVVKTCAVHMILFSAIGLSISAGLIHMYSGEPNFYLMKTPEKEIPVSVKFRVWLFVVTTTVLIISFVFNYNLQTETAAQDARLDLEVSTTEIIEDYTWLRENNVSLTELSAHVGSHGCYVIMDASGNITGGDLEDGSAAAELRDAYNSHGDAEYYEITLNGEKWMCRNAALKDGDGVLAMLPNSEIYQYRDMQAYETLLADILLFNVIYILISLLVQLIVVDNLKLVNESLGKITEGDLEERVSVYKSSEFASLSDDINMTVDVLKGYIEAAEKRMEQELLLAHTIQDSALPTNFKFQHGGFEIFASMDPAKEVGGDFYDFFFVGPDKLALVIADVSGKGVPAALFMMHSKTAIRSLAETGTEITEVLRKVNDELCESNQAEMFVTVWMAVADLKSGIVTCVNAGHEYPAVMKCGEGYALLKDKHRPPLGCIAGMTYTSYEIRLEPGDCIYVYTDGIPEAINTDEEQYETDRMLEVLNENTDTDMAGLLRAVKLSVDGFAGDAEQFDDQTMLGFRYIGMSESK